MEFILISEEELKLEKSALNKFSHPLNKLLKSVIFEASKWEKSTDSIYSTFISFSQKLKKLSKLVTLFFKYISISEPASIFNLSFGVYFLFL